MTITAPTTPATGTWAIDPGHAQVGFVGRHLVFTKIRGRFTGVTGTVVIADDPEASRVDVVIDMASVESGDASRDEHLRSSDLFDVDAFPTAEFHSTAVRWSGAEGQVDGDLTIKGVTRPLTLDVELLGLATDPWGAEKAVFSARATLDREAWGVTWNLPLPTGGLLVSKEIALEIDVELLRP